MSENLDERYSPPCYHYGYDDPDAMSETGNDGATALDAVVLAILESGRGRLLTLTLETTLQFGGKGH